MSHVEILHRLTRVQRSAVAEFAHARGSFEHDPRWGEVLSAGLGHQPLWLVASVDAEADPDLAASDRPASIEGVLPLALVRSRLFGRFLVSLPYLNRAGVLADSPSVARRLVARARELAVEHRVQYLELRHDAPLEHETLSRRRADKVRMVLELPPDVQTLWNTVNAKVRNQLRKAERYPFVVRTGGPERLDAFYDVFAENMRDLGTPVFPKKLFAAILDRFGEQAELVTLEHAGEPAAGALLLHTPQGAQVPSASCLRRYNPTNANMHLYRYLLRRAIERGASTFDFGRSSEGSGTYRFKKQWGARPVATVWQYAPLRGDVDRMRPDHPRQAKKVEAWKKLPVWVTRLAGPVVVRGIP